MDRMDIRVLVEAVGVEALQGDEAEESSSAVRERVERARGLQKKRFRGTGIRHNSVIPGSEIRRYCPLGSAEEAFLRKAFRVMDISARAYHRIIRVARTIADLEGGEEIRTEHLQEAVAYRMENIYY